MKKATFLILTFLSLLFFTLAGMLIYAFFTDENPGMVMIYLIPFLALGLLAGIVPILIKKYNDLALGKLGSFLHSFHLVIFASGVIGLIYTLSQ